MFCQPCSDFFGLVLPPCVSRVDPTSDQCHFVRRQRLQSSLASLDIVVLALRGMWTMWHRFCVLRPVSAFPAEVVDVSPEAV